MRNKILILGDILAIAIITLIGFATHGEMDVSFLPRMAALFFPLVIVWFVLASRFRLFDPAIVLNPRQLWRPALIMIFTVPLAVVIRSALLGSGVTPIFILIFGFISTFAMVIWRMIWYWITKRA